MSHAAPALCYQGYDVTAGRGVRTCLVNAGGRLRPAPRTGLFLEKIEFYLQTQLVT